jgi:hypothetical protein
MIRRGFGGADARTCEKHVRVGNGHLANERWRLADPGGTVLATVKTYALLPVLPCALALAACSTASPTGHTDSRSVAPPTNPSAVLTTKVGNQLSAEVFAALDSTVTQPVVVVTYIDEKGWFRGAHALHAFVRVGYHDASGQDLRASTDIPLERSDGIVYTGTFDLPTGPGDLVVDFVEAAVSDPGRVRWDSQGQGDYHLTISSARGWTDEADRSCRIALDEVHRDAAREHGELVLVGTITVDEKDLAPSGAPIVRYRASGGGAGAPFHDVPSVRRAGETTVGQGHYDFVLDSATGDPSGSVEIVAWVPTKDGYRLFDHNTIADKNVVLSATNGFQATGLCSRQR